MAYSIETLSPQAILGIRAHTRVSEIADTIGRLLPQLMQVAGKSISGPVIARYHAWEDDEGEMELAVHVAPGTQGRGEVVAGELPGGRAAVALHIGPYDGLKKAWADFGAWMAEEGLQGRDAAWEEYVSDCDVVPAGELQTRILCPLRN